MSRVCPLTGKGPHAGNNRSHSLRATRRKWNVNLQPVKVNINGRVVTMKLSTRALKTLRKSSKKAA
ncbi:MAG: 50S ribosomal protein L28 [Bacillales bacterium]|nr:50S ribosomal protein L28 [Bacillales bacterium]